MIISIKDENMKFNVRVGALIFNSDETKIFVQRQNKKDYYMFPGGRLELFEDTNSAISRELNEELGIKEVVRLKYVTESFMKFSKGKYHELGYYYVVKIDEKEYNYDTNGIYYSLDEENDGKSIFMWLDIDQLDKFHIIPKAIKERLLEKNNNKSEIIEHLIGDEQI